MSSVFIRILLRYLAMALVTYGYLSLEDAGTISSDPDIAMFLEIGLGVVIAGATELWHWFTMPSKKVVKG